MKRLNALILERADCESFDWNQLIDDEAKNQFSQDASGGRPPKIR